tara:strand:- start:578 stop:958 length:381 start_codon:yes stop_codon:yes gene_type:complete
LFILAFFAVLAANKPTICITFFAHIFHTVAAQFFLGWWSYTDPGHGTTDFRKTVRVGLTFLSIRAFFTTRSTTILVAFFTVPYAIGTAHTNATGFRAMALFNFCNDGWITFVKHLAEPRIKLLHQF